jgi:hypothetical protein
LFSDLGRRQHCASLEPRDHTFLMQRIINVAVQRGNAAFVMPFIHGATVAATIAPCINGITDSVPPCVRWDALFIYHFCVVLYVSLAMDNVFYPNFC